MNLSVLPTPPIVIGGLLSRRSIDAGPSSKTAGRGVYGWPTQVAGHDELVVGKRTMTRVEAANQTKDVLP